MNKLRVKYYAKKKENHTASDNQWPTGINIRGHAVLRYHAAKSSVNA